MKTVIVDAFTSNPGDLSWDSIAQITDLTSIHALLRTNCSNASKMPKRY